VNLSAMDLKPEVLAGADNVEAIAMTGDVTCAVHGKGGRVDCWRDPRQHVPVTGITGATDIALGGDGDACALIAGGNVACWKIGMPAISVTKPPEQIASVKATAIGVGTGFACALTEDRKVQCWSTTDNKPSPVPKK
jgi:hypothetical protein